MKNIQLQQIDGDLTYTFAPDGTFNAKTQWKRLDKNVTIVFIDHLGWCVLDEELNQVGWPFAEIQSLDSETPPEGKWISWKKGKSYLYNLILIEE